MTHGDILKMFEENEVSEKSQGGTEQCKRAIQAKLPPELVDNFQVICSRVREINPDKIRIYWVHDLPHDPETKHLDQENSRDRFHKIVFCGHWQYNQYLAYLGMPCDHKLAVIDTPIEPFRDLKPKSKEGPIRLIYTSTPQRGLQLLVPVFTKLSEKYDNIHLDVFSSFAIYGWEDADKQFSEIFDICKSHPQITYHGFQPNDVVRKAYEDAHIFAYPSIWPECNSRALIEGMSAGCLCLHPNYAGLSDTSGGLTAQYQWDQDANTHANKFYQLLDHSVQIVNNEDTQNYLEFVKCYTDARYDIKKIAGTWEDMMRALLEQYPQETRSVPKESFTYKAG